jgi:hypothetical protein
MTQPLGGVGRGGIVGLATSTEKAFE